MSDEVQESWVINGLHQLGATLRSREITRVHLHQENSETVNVHLGCLEGGVTGLGGGVHWTSRILGLQLALEVGSAVVRDLGQPASVGRGLEENVGTTEVPVDDAVWGYVVEVVQGSGHVDYDGKDVFQREASSWTSVDESSEASRHELCQNGHPSLQSCLRKRSKLGWLTLAATSISRRNSCWW